MKILDIIASAIILETLLVDRVNAEFYVNIENWTIVKANATEGILTIKE